MSYRIRCWTLFDITNTGVVNRSKPPEHDIENWIHRRNTQCNYDTLLQVISLRSQPEVVRVPVKVEMTDEIRAKFGMSVDENAARVCWKFEFEVQHPSVFYNGNEPFGSLYKDCEGVPMILCDRQNENVTSLLNITPELKNIHFEEL